MELLRGAGFGEKLVNEIESELEMVRPCCELYCMVSRGVT